jgi:hypothetical protein
MSFSFNEENLEEHELGVSFPPENFKKHLYIYICQTFIEHLRYYGACTTGIILVVLYLGC